MNDFYNAALAIADRKLVYDKIPTKLKSPRLGTGGQFTNIFLWDTVFSVMWAKYHPQRFPVTDSLDNFYASQEEDGFISREIQSDGRSRWLKEHPVSFAVPILSWAELELYNNGFGKERLQFAYPHLKRYHQFNQSHYRLPCGLYFSDCFGSGMDDMPRWDEVSEVTSQGGIPFDRSCILTQGEEGDNDYRWLMSLKHLHFDWNRQLIWCDTSCQMAFDALNLSRIAKILGYSQDVAIWQDEHAQLADLINTHCYDEVKGFYFDRLGDKMLSRQHIGAFWAMLAEVATPEHAGRLAEALGDESRFNRPCGIPSLAANDPDFNLQTGYWRGPVWCPTVYMVLRGLRTYGYHEMACQIARKFYSSTEAIWRKTGTIWENYSPDQCELSLEHGKDFCGWSALAPISIFREFLQ